VQSLSRTYGPNEYTVWLSPDDRKQFDNSEDELKRGDVIELGTARVTFELE
jgi:hypothetical protein